MTKPKDAFDPRSAEPVLYYVGPGVDDQAPATDLSANHLARIAWVRGGQHKTPSDVSQAAITAIRDELIATGNWQETPSE